MHVSVTLSHISAHILPQMIAPAHDCLFESSDTRPGQTDHMQVIRCVMEKRGVLCYFSTALNVDQIIMKVGTIGLGMRLSDCIFLLNAPGWHTLKVTAVADRRDLALSVNLGSTNMLNSGVCRLHVEHNYIGIFRSSWLGLLFIMKQSRPPWV